MWETIVNVYTNAHAKYEPHPKRETIQECQLHFAKYRFVFLLDKSLDVSASSPRQAFFVFKKNMQLFKQEHEALFMFVFKIR